MGGRALSDDALRSGGGGADALAADPEVAAPRSVYEAPLLYDIAFSWRDFAAEAEGIASLYRAATGREALPSRVLELAAGPADHAIAFARTGASVVALDRSEAMCGYARQKCAWVGARVEVVCTDMVDFDLGRRFDLAFLASNSLAHLHRLDLLVAHLQAVARHLEPGGVYAIEALHPAAFVGRGRRRDESLRAWTVERFGIEVHTRWGSPDDPYDPVHQIFEAQVEMRVRDDAGERVLRERVPMRDWTKDELVAAARLAGGFEVFGIFGDFDPGAPVEADPQQLRMVLVLRRT